MLFQKLYPNGFKSRTLPEIDSHSILIRLNKTLEKFEEILVVWIENMMFSDIRKTISPLEEVNFFITYFHNYTSPLFSLFFHIHMFLNFFRHANELSGLEPLQRQKLSEKKITLDALPESIYPPEKSVHYALLISSIQHIRLNLENIILPFPVESLFSAVLSTIFKIF
jgi:hypothetical protein